MREDRISTTVEFFILYLLIVVVILDILTTRALYCVAGGSQRRE